MSRLTVSQLYNIQQPTRVGQKLHIQSIFFTNHYIYIIDQSDSKILKRISFKKFETLEQIKLPEIVEKGKIKTLTEIKDILVFGLEGLNDLFYINKQKVTIRLTSHMQPINKVILYDQHIATCSDDLTIRIWNQEKGFLVHSKTKHAYCGHTGKITCLQSYHNILMSGSQDQTVIFWKNDKIYCQYKSNSPIKNFLKCSESQQFLIFTQNGEISVLNITSIIKNKKVQILRIIQYVPQTTFGCKYLFDNCFEIDDSFVLFTDSTNIVFVEINLGKIINKRQLTEKNDKIAGIKCFGRMLIYGMHHDNLNLIRF